MDFAAISWNIVWQQTKYFLMGVIKKTQNDAIDVDDSLPTFIYLANWQFSTKLNI